MGSFVNSPSRSWVLNTTAARLRAATTASCGAPPPTTLMKTANTDSVLTSVSLSCGSPVLGNVAYHQSGRATDTFCRLVDVCSVFCSQTVSCSAEFRHNITRLDCLPGKSCFFSFCFPFFGEDYGIFLFQVIALL